MLLDLTTETETMGSYHCELSKKLDEVDKRVKEFREEQKGERTKVRLNEFNFALWV